MYRREHLYCLHDAGRIESTGRFVTRRGETIEVGLCQFDGIFSGFRWNETTGWEPVFVERYDWSRNVVVLDVCDDTKDDPYTEAEIAADLERWRASLAESSPPKVSRVEPHDIARYTIALEADGDAKPLFEREKMWDYAATGEFGGISRLVSYSHVSADWRSWFSYAGGDAIILLLDGTLQVDLDEPSGRTIITLDRAGAFAVIPRGTWHTVTVRRPATVLTVYPCGETHRRSK